MKNKKNEILDFSKHAIIELNDEHLLKINAGTKITTTITTVTGGASTEPTCLKIRPTSI